MTVRSVSSRRALTLVCAAVWVSGYAGGADAQQAAEPADSYDLPPLDVTAKKSKKSVAQKKAPQAAAPAAQPQPQPVPDQQPSSGDAVVRANAAFANVPSGVSVMTGDEVEARGLRTARDLAQSFPNVTGFDSGGNRMTTFSIRGVHELGYQSSPGVVPGVGYYVDDVPALTTLARASLFTRVDQIDVLKGPQSTSFGFSRPAGVIDIRTGGPTDRPTGYVTASAGNYDAYEAGAGFSTPLGSNSVFLTADFIGQRRDGFYDNTALGDSYGDKESYGGRAKLTVVPTSRTTIDIILQHERFDDQSDPFIPFAQLATDPFEVTYNDPGRERIGQDLQALRVKSRFDGFDLLSVTAHRRSTWDFKNDGDQTASYDPMWRYVGYSEEEVRSLTQEVRLNSNDPDARLQWSAGMFAAHTVMDFSGGTFLYPDIEIPGMPIRHAETTSDDMAVFGELRYGLGGGFTIVPGVRYEWAGREGENRHPAPNITHASKDYAEVLPSLALLYAPTSNFTAYAKYTRGFKPGGFIADRALTDIDEFRFDEETSDNYEVGFKSRPFGGFLTLNGSLFYSDTEDYQVVNQFSPFEFGVNNAERVESYGGELEASLQMTSQLRLFGGLGVTHATFRDFRNDYADFSGNDVSFIPAFTTNYGFEYRADWGGYVIVDGRTLGDYYLDEANAAKQDGVTLVNATVGFKYGDMDIAVFGRNIFDERYVVNSYDFAGTGGTGAYGSLGDPATYGVRTKMSF
ncbi:TonB-dependent receptor [Hyphomicrobium sp.]|uniref:TonB-dependent receptor n=1 Tax=Hyphomicrobium sp. TaxID=82 RepID=UPI0025C266BD|nr:TonB-dependent receptor [Hyphomicrobium sp.]MCC7254049.1 TonB-dependent receptor [Hyphomicrobium sp.]